MRIKFLLLLFLIPTLSFSQSIVYSDPVGDLNISNFSIIGKVNENFLVYDIPKHSIIAYDDNMKLISTLDLTFLPDTITSLNFIAYQNFCIIIFQTHENKIIYCKALKITDVGKPVSTIKIIDSSSDNILNGEEGYAVSVSENKHHILFNRELWGLKDNELQMDQIIMDENFNVEKNDHYFIPFQLGEKISNAAIDNDGNIIFLTWQKISNERSIILYKSPVVGHDLIMKDITINKYALNLLNCR